MAINLDAALRLKKNGWILEKNKGPEIFKEWTESLGSVFYTTDIRLEPNSQQNAFRPEPFSRHMDSPDANYVAWLALNADDGSCPMVIVDSLPMMDSFEPEILNSLKKIDTFYFDLKEKKRMSIPLIGTDDSLGDFLRYFPYDFKTIKPRDEEETHCLRVLEERINSLPEKLIHFAEGDIVILDNRRMLHGRGAMRADSPRHLFRAWVHTGEKY